ncbi:uncharacterized protein LOC111915615 [Lactuca sativa]|uniref:uncharacterized protein LOC111915615 n=1 Tax=Lactuca sativa TaxID=4236 RepID=UPI000CD9DB32|nr:uncharacterized protein LOC111915615 [Lactuca sativa]
MKAVPSTYHQCVKMPTLWGTLKIMGDQQESKECYKTSIKPTTKPQQAYQLRRGARHVLEKKEQNMKEVPLSREDTKAKVLIGSSIPEQIEQDLLNFLRARNKRFAWKHEDMTGIDKNIITHKLNIDPSFRPIHQKRRKCAPRRNQIIQEKLEKLLKTGTIKEVKFPGWLANVVVVQKKNDNWLVCVDYTDHNKACTKDPFPLPHIDSMIDTTVGDELLTFMDAPAGFQKI